MRTRWNDLHQKIYPVCSYSNNKETMFEKYDQALEDFKCGRISSSDLHHMQKAIDIFQQNVYDNITYATLSDAEILMQYLLEEKS